VQNALDDESIRAILAKRRVATVGPIAKLEARSIGGLGECDADLDRLVERASDVVRLFRRRRASVLDLLHSVNELTPPVLVSRTHKLVCFAAAAISRRLEARSVQ
jgi:hypothetical protein